jgi:acetamidase/formamidase
VSTDPIHGATRHVIDPTSIHHDWDDELEPALVIASGDVVEFELLMAGHGQVVEGGTPATTAFDFDTIYNLVGPVHVEGAAPGATLQIEILELMPGAWGWTSVIPGLGLLPDDFPDPILKIWDLRDGTTTRLCDGVSIPLRPFLGTMGVTPGRPGKLSPFPPHRGGGNMDNRHLEAGTTLWLPVWKAGAQFSCGDPHASQGDGEVCVSAIECPMTAVLRLTAHEQGPAAPSFFVPAGRPSLDAAGYHGTMGIAPDLMEGAQLAVRGMIDWLAEDRGLTREDAYVLCSVAGDLKIHEIVDAGVWNVGFTMPMAVFEEA